MAKTEWKWNTFQSELKRCGYSDKNLLILFNYYKENNLKLLNFKAATAEACEIIDIFFNKKTYKEKRSDLTNTDLEFYVKTVKTYDKQLNEITEKVETEYEKRVKFIQKKFPSLIQYIEDDLGGELVDALWPDIPEYSNLEFLRKKDREFKTNFVNKHLNNYSDLIKFGYYSLKYKADPGTGIKDFRGGRELYDLLVNINRYVFTYISSLGDNEKTTIIGFHVPKEYIYHLLDKFKPYKHLSILISKPKLIEGDDVVCENILSRGKINMKEIWCLLQPQGLKNEFSEKLFNFDIQSSEKGRMKLFKEVLAVVENLDF